MAELIATTGGVPEQHRRMLRLEDMITTATISAAATITARSGHFISLNGGASNRNVDFVAGDSEQEGMWFHVKNHGTTNSLVIRDSATATLATLTPGQFATFAYTGAAWQTFNPATVAGAITSLSGLTSVVLTDNTATALDFTEAANSYLKFTTTNSGEKVTISKALALLLGIDLSGAASSISILDNDAAALDIKEGSTSYLKFVTTNSSESVTVGKPLLFNGGIAPGCRFTSTEQTGTASPQNVAHGLGSTPSMVWFSVSEASGAFDVAPGAHDATNCVFTVTSGVKFYVHALK